MQRRLSAEVLDAIVTAYQIGEVIRPDRSALRRGSQLGTRAAATTRRRRPGRQTVQADVEQLVALYARGLTQRAVGERFGVTRRAVRAVLLKHGVRLRERTRSG